MIGCVCELGAERKGVVRTEKLQRGRILCALVISTCAHQAMSKHRAQQKGGREKERKEVPPFATCNLSNQPPGTQTFPRPLEPEACIPCLSAI